MVRAEAEAFCRQNPTACVRFSKSHDGEVITADSNRSGWFRKLAWIVPAWLGLSAGVGCLQRTQGAMCMPKPVTAVSTDTVSIRAAEAAAIEPARLLNKNLRDVARSFGLEFGSEPSQIVFSIDRSQDSRRVKCVWFTSSAGDDVCLYLPSGGPKTPDGDMSNYLQDEVIGIAVKSQKTKFWNTAGIVDAERHAN
jgi:hypothetical protein